MRKLAGFIAFWLGFFWGWGKGIALLSAEEVGRSSSRVAQPLVAPEIEERALALGRTLRCVVCQNQSIAESNAHLAQDLMHEVRRMLAEGRSEEQIVAFLVERYGEFVLFEPPFDWRTLLLWVGPFVLALGGIGWLWSIVRRSHFPASASGSLGQLDDRLRAEADRLLRDDQPV